MSDEDKALIEGRCCAVCKHCFYTGLPGAFGCEFTVFVDPFDTCDKWESDEKFVEDADEIMKSLDKCIDEMEKIREKFDREGCF